MVHIEDQESDQYSDVGEGDGKEDSQAVVAEGKHTSDSKKQGIEQTKQVMTAAEIDAKIAAIEDSAEEDLQVFEK